MSAPSFHRASIARVASRTTSPQVDKQFNSFLTPARKAARRKGRRTVKIACMRGRG